MSKKLWTLEDGLTQSALRLWLRCPHQFWLTYVRGLSPKFTSTSIEFGTLFHRLLECHDELPEDVAHQYYREAKQGGISLQEEQKLNWVVETALVVYEQYRNFWRSQLNKMEFVTAEEVFDSHVETSLGQSVRLRGRIDGIFKLRSGSLYILETKTKGRIQEDLLRDALPFDFQSNMYALAEHRQISGFQYNVIRIPQLIQRKDESLGDYCRRLTQDITSRPAWYFMQWRHRYRKDELKMWKRRILQPILTHFVLWWKSVENLTDPFQSPLHYMNPDALVSSYGGKCMLFDYITRGSAYGLTVRRTPFPELEE